MRFLLVSDIIYFLIQTDTNIYLLIHNVIPCPRQISSRYPSGASEGRFCPFLSTSRQLLRIQVKDHQAEDPGSGSRCCSVRPLSWPVYLRPRQNLRKQPRDPPCYTFCYTLLHRFLHLSVTAEHVDFPHVSACFFALLHLLHQKMIYTPLYLFLSCKNKQTASRKIYDYIDFSVTSVTSVTSGLRPFIFNSSACYTSCVFLCNIV